MRYLLLLFLIPHFLYAIAFARFSSAETQIPSPGVLSQVLFTSIDAIQNVSLSKSKNQVIIQEDGVYCLMIVAQAGAASIGANGYVDVWLTKNDEDIADSNGRKSIDESTQMGTLVSQFATPLKKDDQIGIRFSSSEPNLGLISLHPENEPSISSIALTLFKLD